MPEYYIDFDTIIIEARNYQEALKKARKIVDELEANKDFPGYMVNE
jgi:hypothetical protein